MKDSDQTIERVLAGLRDAKAPEGIERRILNGVQHHTASGIRRGWLMDLASLIAARPVAYAAALAGVAFVLVIPAVHQRRHTTNQEAKVIFSAPLSPASSGAIAKSTELPRPTTISRSLRRPKSKSLEVVENEDALAVLEMNAPSRPAPPLPLTAQEKLLVRFVRTSTPEQLAAVDPAKLAAHDEQERAEFDRFFRRLNKEQAAKVRAAKEKLTQEAMNKF